MGMQQIILLALAVIIVGIATVYGIEAFTLNRTRSNMDAIIQDLVVIGSEAQQWKARPEQFGGQNDNAAGTRRSNPNDFTGFDFSVIGRDTVAAATAGTSYLRTMNGQYAAIVNGTTELQLWGCNVAEGNEILVRVTGIRDEQVVVDNTERKTGLTDITCTNPVP